MRTCRGGALGAAAALLVTFILAASAAARQPVGALPGDLFEYRVGQPGEPVDDGGRYVKRYEVAVLDELGLQRCLRVYDVAAGDWYQVRARDAELYLWICFPGASYRTIESFLTETYLGGPVAACTIQDVPGTGSGRSRLLLESLLRGLHGLLVDEGSALRVLTEPREDAPALTFEQPESSCPLAWLRCGGQTFLLVPERQGPWFRVALAGSDGSGWVRAPGRFISMRECQDRHMFAGPCSSSFELKTKLLETRRVAGELWLRVCVSSRGGELGDLGDCEGWLPAFDADGRLTVSEMADD